jgi:tetratricopeptide (TPR) repeat protein
MLKVLGWAILALAGAAALSTPTHAQSSLGDSRLAEDLAQEAFEAHARGEFLPAIALYKKAYQASPAAMILFNIANIYDKKVGDKQQALTYYQRYLRSSDTEPGLVKRANERIDVVLAELEAARSSPTAARPPSRPVAPSTSVPMASPAAPPPPVAGRGSRWRIVGLGMAAAGLGGLSVGGVYGFIAKSKNDQASEMCNGSVCPDQRGVTLTEEAHRAARVSTMSFIAGGALVAGGVGLFIFAPSRSRERMERAGIRITPGLGGLAISGVWQ